MSLQLCIFNALINVILIGSNCVGRQWTGEEFQECTWVKLEEEEEEETTKFFIICKLKQIRARRMNLF